MLSRVADSAFWMSRYVERAENIARLVDVNLQIALDLPAQQAEEFSRNWSPILASLDCEGQFRAARRKPTAHAVTEFLLFDKSHPDSILGCLAHARENARTIRELIAAEMWEQINRTYLWLMSKGARQFFDRNAYDFFQRVIKALQLFQGITDAVMLRGEGWEFIQMGRHLERADKTSRMLDDAFFLPQTDKNRPGDALPQWHAILRSCNGRHTYQLLYAAEVDPLRVSELLLLNPSFPRSILFCVHHVDEALRRISGASPGRFSNVADKLSGRLLSKLNFSSIEEYWQPNLHEAIDELQVNLNDIGSAIYEAYISPAEPRIQASPVGTLPIPQ